jgi:hypothetical protein
MTNQSTIHTCRHCSAPYENAERGACSICIHMQFVNILALITLKPGKDRQ